MAGTGEPTAAGAAAAALAAAAEVSPTAAAHVAGAGDRVPCETGNCARSVRPGRARFCCAWCADPADQPAPHTEGCDRRHIERAGIEAVIAGE